MSRPLVVGSDALFMEAMRNYETRRIGVHTTGPSPWFPSCTNFPLVRFGQPGLALEHICEQEQIVHMPPFLVVDATVFDLNPGQNVSRRAAIRFAPYWIAEAILVHHENQVPSEGYREAHAIEAFSALLQHNEFGSIKAGTGWPNPTAHAFIDGRTIHMKHWHDKKTGGNPQRHHHRMYVPTSMPSAHMGNMAYYN